MKKIITIIMVTIAFIAGGIVSNNEIFEDRWDDLSEYLEGFTKKKSTRISVKKKMEEKRSERDQADENKNDDIFKSLAVEKLFSKK